MPNIAPSASVRVEQTFECTGPDEFLIRYYPRIVSDARSVVAEEGKPPFVRTWKRQHRDRPEVVLKSRCFQLTPTETATPTPTGGGDDSQGSGNIVCVRIFGQLDYTTQTPTPTP